MRSGGIRVNEKGFPAAHCLQGILKQHGVRSAGRTLKAGGESLLLRWECFLTMAGKTRRTEVMYGIDGLTAGRMN